MERMLNSKLDHSELIFVDRSSMDQLDQSKSRSINNKNTVHSKSGAKASEGGHLHNSNIDNYKADDHVTSSNTNVGRKDEQGNYTRKQDKQKPVVYFKETTIAVKNNEDMWDLIELSDEIVSKADYIMDKFPTPDTQKK